MLLHLWPTGLIGRVGLVLFMAVVLLFAGSAALLEKAETFVGDQNQAERIADGVETAARVLALTPVEHRSSVAATLSEKALALRWQAKSGPLAGEDGRSRALRARIIAADPSLAALALASTPTGATGTLPLRDGSALAFDATTRSPVPSITQLWPIALLSGGVLLAALLLVRVLAAPLRLLVTATDAIGNGPAITIKEQGPRDVRRVARAFNAMQARIVTLIADRTQALAAVSHDLRTPIGRMQLRAGFLPVENDRAAFEADLDEMQAMLDDLSAYLAGDTDPEKPRRTDLAVTLAALVDDAADAGHPVRYVGPDRLVIQARALALKRAFSNLLDNAISYGEWAAVTLRDTEHAVVAIVEDEGPGIPAAELLAVFEPFYRGDASRSRSTGGMGLGLAIARQAIAREGGSVVLENRREGGLRATVVLPKECDRSIVR